MLVDCRPQILVYDQIQDLSLILMHVSNQRGIPLFTSYSAHFVLSQSGILFIPDKASILLPSTIGTM